MIKRIWQRVLCWVRGVHGDYNSLSFRAGCYICSDCGRWWVTFAAS